MRAPRAGGRGTRLVAPLLGLGLLLGTPAVAQEAVPADDDEAIVFGSDPEPPAQAASPTEAAPREGPLELKAELRTQVWVQAHTSQEDLHILELGLIGRLELKKRLGESVAVKLGGRARYHHFLPRWSFAGVPDPSARTVAEFQLDEAWIDLYLSFVDLRFGNQRFAWGANPGLAPADVFGAMDLRFGLAEGLLGGAEAKLPVPAISARSFLGPVTLRAVVQPIFVPDRVWLFGYDLSLASARLPVALPDPSLLGYDWTGIDQVQPFMLHTRLPPPTPKNWQGALRLEGRFGPADLGLTAFTGWDHSPRFRIDPDLARIMAAQSQGEEPPLAALLAVMQRLEQGEALFESWLGRTRVLAADATVSWRDLSFRADLGATFARTFVALSPGSVAEDPPEVGWFSGRALTGALGFEYLDLEGLTLGLVAQAFLVLEVPAGVVLPLYESVADFPGTVPGAARDLLSLSLLPYGRFTAFDERLEILLGGLFHPLLGDFVLAPAVSWKLSDHHRLTLSAELLGGPAGTPAALLGHQDRVGLGWTASL